LKEISKMKITLFIFSIITLFFCIVKAEEEDQFKEAKQYVRSYINRNYGGIYADIYCVEYTSHLTNCRVIQTAYGLEIKGLDCYLNFDTDRKVITIDDFCNLRNNLSERYLDDVDPFDMKEIIKAVNRIRYNNAYTLNFDEINIFQGEDENTFGVENLPFTDVPGMTLVKNYGIVNDNLIEASVYCYLEYDRMQIGGYSKEKLSTLDF